MSNSSKFILVVGGDMSYGVPYAKLAKDFNLKFTGNDDVLDIMPDKIALVVFTGGEDVDPSLYKKTKYRNTSSYLPRDTRELAAFKKAYTKGIPMVGICRGAQFLCVMAGGVLVQDVTHHGGYHPLNIRQADGSVKSVQVNSTHHQMQYPFGLPENEYEVIGWMEEPLSNHYAFDAKTVVMAADADSSMLSEPDIVFYPEIRALAAQYHPEWLPTDSEGFRAYEELVDRFIAPMLTDDENRTKAA